MSDRMAVSLAVMTTASFRRTVSNRPNGVSFRIPAVPCVSSCTQSPSSSCPLESSRVLLVPELHDTAVTSPHDLKASGKPSRRRDLCDPADRLPTLVPGVGFAADEFVTGLLQAMDAIREVSTLVNGDFNKIMLSGQWTGRVSRAAAEAAATMWW